MHLKRGVSTAVLVIFGAAASGCLFVPLPGVDGESCTVEANDAGVAIVTCPDGSSVPLFATNPKPVGDAGFAPDEDGVASLDGGPAADDAGDFECTDREGLAAGESDPCGRAIEDNPEPIDGGDGGDGEDQIDGGDDEDAG